MALKSVTAIYLEAQEADLPFLETIQAALQLNIDEANLDSEVFEVVYDATTELNGLGVLQQTRILRELSLRLRALGYRTSVNYEGFTITVSWTYLGL